MADPPSIPGEFTSLLRSWGDGDQKALAAVASLAYGDLKAIASGYLRREGRDHTLQATSLVNELFIRLLRQESVQLSDRRHFYAFAAMLMRRILADYARLSRAAKRPASSATRVPLHEEMAWVDASGEELLSLDLAIDELHALDPRKARVVELRYFLGCTNDEAAEVLGIGRATIDRDLQFAKAWLYRRLCPEDGVPVER